MESAQSATAGTKLLWLVTVQETCAVPPTMAEAGADAAVTVRSGVPSAMGIARKTIQTWQKIWNSSLQESGPAPLGAHAMLVLLSRGYLPADAEQVVNTSSCAVWRSATLRRAVGLLYAKATAIAQAGSAAGSARIEATSHSAC